MCGALSRGLKVVMATNAGSLHLGMIYSRLQHRNPGNWIHFMAGVTGIAGGDMLCRFATGTDTIVASNTVSNKPSMIDYRDIQPIQGIVTGITFLTRGHMNRGLSCRNSTIMAGRTYLYRLCMIKRSSRNRHPFCRRDGMTSVANIGRGHTQTVEVCTTGTHKFGPCW